MLENPIWWTQKKGKTRKAHKQNVASRAYLHSKMYNKNVTNFRFNLFGRTVFPRRPIQWHTISPSLYPLDPRPPTPDFVLTSTSQFVYSSETFSEEYYWTLHDIYWTKVENSFSKQTNIKILFRYFEGRAQRQRPDTTRTLSSSFHVPKKRTFSRRGAKENKNNKKSKRCSLFHLYYNQWISKQASANGFV